MKKYVNILLCFSVIVVITMALSFSNFATVSWVNISPGIDLGKFKTKKLSPVGNSTIVILRVDPELLNISFFCIDQLGLDHGLTAKEWCQKYKMAAAINAGMFDHDYETHIGYLRNDEYVNSGKVNHYKSVVAFNPKMDDIPKFRIFDLDNEKTSIEEIEKEYLCFAQNLRLIKRPGENRWTQQDKMWSEAALGEDEEGRILFIFCRSPFTMHDLNNELISLGIDLVCAQHLEGGPEAQLFVNIEGNELELFGSYETSFKENDSNDHAWAIPNVIGVYKR